jgi:hypothetical protein
MLQAELIRTFITSRGNTPAGEIVSGDDAQHALACGAAIPVREERKIERAVIRTSKRSVKPK